MSIRDYKSILITGGTGSFGQAFVEEILTNYPNFKRVVVFSRDELKQWNMRQKYSEEKYDQLMKLGDKSIEPRENIIRLYPQKICKKTTIPNMLLKKALKKISI